MDKKVVAVVAGHMHRRLKGRGRRCAFVERDGTVYVNAAEVPRIVRDRQAGSARRHHVELCIESGICEARDVWISAEGNSTIPGDDH